MELKLSAWCDCFVMVDGDVEVLRQGEETPKTLVVDI